MTPDNLRAALAELVRLEDLRTRAGQISPVETGCEKEILMDEWRKAVRPAWAAARAALASPSAAPDAPDNSKVICPSCAHQFRAIPCDVQRLMLDVGFEPPFTDPPSAAPDAQPVAEVAPDHESFGCRWLGAVIPPEGTKLYAHPQQRIAEPLSDRTDDLLRWCYTKLHYRSFDSMEDALMLDKIKLLLEHGIGSKT